MTVIWHPDARLDLTDLLDRSASFGSDAPMRAMTAIESAVTALTAHPMMGRPGRARDTREIVLRKIPYILVYRVRSEGILILALRHTSRDWPRAFPEAQ